MAIHKDLDYQCVNCETYFLPFQSPFTLCPDCSEPNLQPEEFREIIKEYVDIMESCRIEFGKFEPRNYKILSLFDHYILYIALAFDEFIKNKSPWQLVVEKTIENEGTLWETHLREMLYLIFEEAIKRNLFEPQRTE